MRLPSRSPRHWRCSTVLLIIIVCVLLLALSSSRFVAARPTSVLQWNVADVQSWLQELSVAAGAEEEWRDYADAFAEHEVDGKALMRLGLEELEALKSSSSADVSLLVAAVQALRDTTAKAASAAAAAASRSSRVSESAPHQIADLSSFTRADNERIQTLEAFLHFQPEDVPSLLQLAHIYLRSEKTAPRAKQLIDQADEAFKKSSGGSGSNPDVLAANGDFFRLYGQTKKALGFYTRALQQDPLAGGDGAEIRLHFASVLFEEARSLAESSDSTFEAKHMLERMVNVLCEALMLLPRPDFQPRLTPHQAAIHAALTPQEAANRVGDIEVDLRDRYDTVKLLLVQAYLQLSRMYEGQARTYLAQLKAHPDFSAHVVQLDDSPRSSIPPRALSPEQREEFERVQGHMAHLFAMAYSYAARIVDSVSELSSPLVTTEARDELTLLRSTVSHAKESMERMQQQWTEPLARIHAEMMHEQLASGLSSIDPAYDLFTLYNAHLSNATQLIRAAQFQPPRPTRGAFVHHKMIASMLHAQCKTAAARELISSIREPVRDARTNETLVSLREEEYYLRSSAFPALFTNRKDVRAARAAWEARVDRMLAEARNTTAIVTARLEMTDEQIARFPPLPHSARWIPTDQLERSRFVLNSLPSHGLNNRRLVTKLAQFYLALTTPLPSREDPQPKSWLSFEAPGLGKSATGEYEDVEVRATFSALGSAGSAAATVEAIRARPAGAKIKIAFVAALHPSLPSLSWLAGYLLHLPRDRFEVCMFEINLSGSGDSAEWVMKEDALGEGESSLYARVHKRLSTEGMWRNLAHRNVERARSEIMQFAPDVIVFSGLGHDPLSYFLAFSRLAPVQSVFLPASRDTSGIPHSIDFGIDFRSMFAEESEAQKGFSERLQLLPGIGWIPRPAEMSAADLSKTRDDYELSNTQLTERWHVQFNDSAMHAASDGSLPESELFSDASGRRRPMFLVASDNPAAYSPSFLEALARILVASPSAILVVLLDPGVALSPVKESAGEEQMGLLYAGAKSQCKDIVLDRIEALMANEKPSTEHPDARLIPEGADFVAQLTRFMPPGLQGRAHLRQSGRVRFMRRPHETKALRQLMNVADVLLQSFPMDGQSSTWCACVCACFASVASDSVLPPLLFALRPVRRALCALRQSAHCVRLCSAHLRGRSHDTRALLRDAAVTRQPHGRGQHQCVCGDGGQVGKGRSDAKQNQSGDGKQEGRDLRAT